MTAFDVFVSRGQDSTAKYVVHADRWDLRTSKDSNWIEGHAFFDAQGERVAFFSADVIGVRKQG